MTSSFFRTQILSIIGEDVNLIINFLKSKNLIRRNMSCDFCFEGMKWRPYRKIKDGYVWKCENKSCSKYKTTKSIRSGSIFEDSRIELQMCVYAIYLWSIDTPHKVIVDTTGITGKKVTELNKFLREICRQYFVNFPIKLGGEGVICQIDESLFTYKQKYHRGRVSDYQTWVFGIVDTSFVPARGYMEIVRKRDKQTLLPIIEKICLPGTKIYSDQWPAYCDIDKLGFEHSTVNHSLNFVNPDSGVHTQHIESYWSKQKLRIRKMKGVNKNDLNGYLSEFMWRERFSGNEFFKICECIEFINNPSM